MAVHRAPARRRTIRPSPPRDERAQHDEQNPDDEDADYEEAADDGGDRDDTCDGYDEEQYDEEPHGDRPRPPQRRERPPRADRAPRPPRRRAGRIKSAGAAAQAAVRQIAELIGRRPEGVTAVEPADDGWLIGVEVVEDHRIPSSSDILAIYNVQISADGDLISYRRTARYARGRGDQ